MGLIDEPVKELQSPVDTKISEIQSMGEVEDMDTYQTARFLDVDSNDTETMDKIKSIVEHFKVNGKTNFSDIAKSIHEIEVEIGSPGLGEKRIPRIYRYIKLLAQSQRVQNELSAYKRN